MIKVLCPICRQAMEAPALSDLPYLPFCSRRCKTIDLGRWLNESYRIHAEDEEERTDSAEDDLP
jgi:endogenous inhibitor of DNA gyrase (YacG/DUF329 family)